MERMGRDTENKAERPPLLYHGSIAPHLEKLEPRFESWRDKEEGPQVFATPDKRLATIFAGKTKQMVTSGKFDDTPYAIILEPREKFVENDKGGYIYTLPSENFECDPQKGLGAGEWTCKVTVKPQGAEKFDSALDAMLDAGVQVYFVHESTHQAILKSEDHGYSILKNLKSENQNRGINIAEF